MQTMAEKMHYHPVLSHLCHCFLRINLVSIKMFLCSYIPTYVEQNDVMGRDGVTCVVLV